MMQIFLVVILTVMGVIASLATAEVPGVLAVAGEVDSWVRALGDDDFRVREQATLRIWEQGEGALSALRGALKSSDPEQRFRARDLIDKIELHITPVSDPAVIALVERYAKALPTEKFVIFAQLRVKHGWRQLLKLYAAESDAGVRAKLQPAVDGVAVLGARECLLRGDVRGAREVLELAPADADGLLALAEFHRSQGTLVAELQRARAFAGRKSATWQLALQRAAGNLESAGQLAVEVGERPLAAALAALAGDPLPWLREEVRHRSEADRDLFGPVYAKAAVHHWLGQKIPAGVLEPLRVALASRNPTERNVAAHALLLVGEIPMAEAAMAKSSPLEGFLHFEALERIPEALQALGLDPAHPDFTTWVAKRLQHVPSDDIEDQHEVSTQSEEVVALANFLERRGLHDDAWAAFSGPLGDIAVKNPKSFLTLLGAVFGRRDDASGAPLLATRVAFEWAGDDDKRWDDIVVAAFGDDEPTREWWAALSEMAPTAPRRERFHGMLALVGLGPDPSHLRDEWLGRAWAAVGALPAAGRQPWLLRLSTHATATGDVVNALKAWDQMSESSRQGVFLGAHILDLSAANRWNEAAAIFREQITRANELNQVPSAPTFAYAAAALRQAGQPVEAAAHDRWAEQLALGDAGAAIEIGNGYAFGRDYPRAAEWWARAARQAAPSSHEFALALRLHADVLLDAGRWQEAAATSEVLCGLYGAADFRAVSSLPLMRQRLQADTARALALVMSNRRLAVATLAQCHRAFASDGSLADVFFPALRKVGLLKEYDAWFNESWHRLAQVLAAYPLADNTRNTAAWFAARSLRNLDEAERLITQALAANPRQAAYLDTMAEIQFAKGNRPQALEWSRAAVDCLPDDPQLRQQQERFRNGPLPK